MEQQASSVNRAVEFAKLKRDLRRSQLKAEKYYVIVKDDKGREYTIKYFF